MLYIYIFPYNGSSKIGYVTCFNIGFSSKVFPNARFCFQSYQDNKFVSLLLASFVTYFVLNCTQIQEGLDGGSSKSVVNKILDN